MILQGITGAIRFLKKSAAGEGLRPARLILRMTLIIGLLVGGLCLIRVTPSVKAPAVVQDISGGEVRTECPGFLIEIAVADGAKVQEGDLLLRLENVEEVSRLHQLERDIDRSRLRRDLYLEEQQLASWQAESQHLSALEESAKELRAYTDKLEVRAPRAGRVLGRHLESLEETWIEPGTLLLTIDAEDRNELVILAAQDDWDKFAEAQAAGRPLEFRPRGRWQTSLATFREMTPRATTDPTHFALITPSDGPIAVRRKSDGAASGGGNSPTASFELTKPRFDIHADLEGEGSGLLMEGEIGTAVAKASSDQSLAALALREVRSRIDMLVESRTGQ